MDFVLTNEQLEYRNEIRNFANEHLNGERYLDVFSYDMWRKTAEFGLFGIVIPETYGGLGENYLTAAIVIEALGYACRNNGFVFAVNNHIWVGLNLIYLYGSENLRNKYIKRMVSGECIGAIAITEAAAGSDAHSMTTFAKKVDGGYKLTGNKMFISNGTIADLFIVFARTDDSGSLAAFVVEKIYEGVAVGQDIEKMGLNSCPMAEVVLDDCYVPDENILGGVNAGNSIMKQALEWERCYEFAGHVGAMQRIMEKCLLYVEQRQQFGKNISEFQGVSHKIADMKMRVELARLMLYKIAWMKDNKKSAYLETSIFKLFVSESYIQTCKDAMQIFGAYGYTKEYEIEREMRDSLACSIYSGTSEMQRNTIFSIAQMDIM